VTASPTAFKIKDDVEKYAADNGFENILFILTMATVAQTSTARHGKI
jgi:hypothetical protein